MLFSVSGDSNIPLSRYPIDAMDEFSLKDITLAGDSLLWQPPGSDRRFALEFNVIDELTPVMMKGYAAVPRRGAEIGGLLTGSVQPDRTTRISGFVHIDVEYAYGPSFQLSARDRKNIEARCNSLRAEGTICVGMYRSNTRPRFELTAPDVELFEALFRDPATVFLLIRPSMTNIPGASLFHQSQITQRQITPRSEFPFRRRELGAPPRQSPARGTVLMTRSEQHRATLGLSNEAEAAPEPVISAPPVAALPDHEPPVRRDHPASWLGYALVGIVALGLGGVVGYQQGVKNGVQQQSVIQSYNVRVLAGRSGNGISVTWPTSSPPVRRADSAVLHIVSDGKSTEVALNKAELLRGAVLFQEPAESFTGRLDLLLDGSTLSTPFTLTK